jgi:hypothetical protein
MDSLFSVLRETLLCPLREARKVDPSWPCHATRFSEHQDPAKIDVKLGYRRALPEPQNMVRFDLRKGEPLLASVFALYPFTLSGGSIFSR